MSKAKMQHCFYCGEELGVYVHYYGDGLEACGKQECQRELRYALQSEQAEREERAREDDYQRY